MKTILFVIFTAIAPVLAQAGCGAISYNANTGAVGLANLYAYLGQAQQASVNHCTNFSGGYAGCFVAVSECNRCAAIAHDPYNTGRWSWGLAYDVNTAVGIALQNCPGCRYEYVCN